MIGSATSNGRVSITGIGSQAPERVMTNDELAKMVDTSDEWIIERTGIRERRVAAPDEAMSDLALPAARAALEQAGVKAVRARPDRGRDRDPGHALPVDGRDPRRPLGAKDAAAYDLSAGCTGFVYAVVQAHGDGRERPCRPRARRRRRRPLEGRRLGGPQHVRALRRRRRRGRARAGAARAVSWASSSAPTDRAARSCTCLPAARVSPRIGRDGGRAPALREDERARGLQVRDAACLSTRPRRCSHECGVSVDDVDVYVPHQANVRIIDHARKKLGIPEERTVVNVDRFGNTSSGSIPLALGDAEADGRLSAR